jgi:hypothetical protein
MYQYPDSVVAPDNFPRPDLQGEAAKRSYSAWRLCSFCDEGAAGFSTSTQTAADAVEFGDALLLAAVDVPDDLWIADIDLAVPALSRTQIDDGMVCGSSQSRRPSTRRTTRQGANVRQVRLAISRPRSTTSPPNWCACSRRARNRSHLTGRRKTKPRARGQSGPSSHN